MSTVFAIGLHPLGARWIQEHFALVPGQETYSYYGPLNKVSFNVGYHNEHHDIVTIPWSRLPQVRRIAPEFYDGLHSYTSWTSLLSAFPAGSQHHAVQRDCQTAGARDLCQQPAQRLVSANARLTRPSGRFQRNGSRPRRPFTGAIFSAAASSAGRRSCSRSLGAGWIRAASLRRRGSARCTARCCSSMRSLTACSATCPAFTFAWNVLIGVPLLVPRFSTKACTPTTIVSGLLRD